MKVDDIQKKALQYYRNTAMASDNKTVMAGRYASDAGKELDILTDIQAKINISEGSKVLDIGCGCGPLSELIIRQSNKMTAFLYMLDIPEVVDQIRKDVDLNYNELFLCEGIFPYEVPNSIKSEKFDSILIYSVLHYTSKPVELIEAAVEMLKSGGKLLIGDIPNVNKKGRFLASNFGRKFDAAYQGIPVDDIPVIADHKQFAEEQNDQARLLNDEFLNDVIFQYRSKGFNAYVVPQLSSLPFSYTREDIIIEKL